MSSQQYDSREQFNMINSVDFVAFSERLPIYKSGFRDIYTYGIDNIYPNKIKEIAKRSNSLQTALTTKARFLRGAGFNGDKTIVNEDGQTLFDVLRNIVDDKCLIGFAIHCTYNVFGHITELTPVDFTHVRKIITEQNAPKLYRINNDWIRFARNQFHVTEESEGFDCYEYDPTAVIEQMKIVGVENYTGQLFYYNPQNAIYPLATCDSVLDDAQSEAESKLYKLSNVQNGFSISGIMKLPFNIDQTKDKNAFLDKIRESGKSPKNAGRIITVTMPNMSEQDGAFSNLFEPISLPNVDAMFQNLQNDSKKNIYELYQQPVILNGRSDSGMFNQQSMQDAYNFYNSITEIERRDIERVLSDLIENSVFYDVPLPIEIKPASFMQTPNTL